MQQQTKHQGSPWKSPGLKSSSPRVSRLPGFEPRLLEPEELAWDSSSDVPPSASSPFVGHDDTSSEAQAAPKEAYSESGASSRVESAGGSHGAQVKKSKGSAQKQAGSNRGSPQGSGLQRGESGWGCAASAARRGVAKVHTPQRLAASVLMDFAMQIASVARCYCTILYCNAHGSTNSAHALTAAQHTMEFPRECDMCSCKGYMCLHAMHSVSSA